MLPNFLLIKNIQLSREHLRVTIIRESAEFKLHFWKCHSLKAKESLRIHVLTKHKNLHRNHVYSI